MNVAYLIMGYKYPQQLRRLVTALLEDWNRCYVHIDAKVDIAPFQATVEGLDKVEFIRDRVKVKWGTFSFVKSILNGFTQICSSRFDSDYIVLLDIQTYPIKSNRHIRAYLAEYDGYQHAYCKALPDPDLVGDHGMDRINRYHFGDFRDHGRIGRIVRMLYQLYTPRVFPEGMKPFVGHCVCFSTGCAEYILEFARRNSKAMRFFKYTFAADEIFFPSLVMSSPFGEKVCPSPTYVDWSERLPHPKILGPEDLPKLQESEKLFARKFDSDQHPQLFDIIDRELRGCT